MNLSSVFKYAAVATLIGITSGCSIHSSRDEAIENIHYSNVVYNPQDRIDSYFDDQYVIYKQLFNDFTVDRTGPREITITIPADHGFLVDRASLNRDMRDRLKTMAETLNDYKETSIYVYGHTDSQGDLNYNLRLSQRRADYIKNLLVQNHVDSPRVKTLAEAFEVPKCPNHTIKGRECNRRVELVVRASAIN